MQRFRLDVVVKTLAAAGSAGEIFNILIEALAGTAPRGAIFLARQREVRGWSSFGYPPETARRQAAFSAAWRDGRLGRVLSDPSIDADRATGADPDFGQGAADESVAIPLSVKGKPIAAILVERSTDDEPWDLAAISVLCTLARLRLELTLAQRKLQAAEPGASASPPSPTTGRSQADPDCVPAGAGPDAAGTAQPATAAVGGSRAPAMAPDLADSELAAARRFARLVATDIRLYNEEAVALGRRNRDLAERLRPSIKRGKDTFVERHGDLGDTGLELLREAFVTVLAAGDPNLLPGSALE